MNRELHIKICNTDGKKVTITIVRQTHRTDDFTPKGYLFDSPQLRVKLSSVAHPSLQDVGTDHPIIFYVRGTRKQYDDNILILPIAILNDLMSVVLHYNQAYTKNKLELSDVVEGLELLGESERSLK